MKIMIAGDTHFPYANTKAVNTFIKNVKLEQPDYIVQIGDLYDFFSSSRFPKKIKIAPDREYQDGLRDANAFWKACRVASPRSKCVQLRGNHDDRPYKRCEEKTPELLYFLEKGMDDFWDFEKVEVLGDSKDTFKIHGVTFHHGWLSSIGAHRDYFSGPVVVGHSHCGGVVYRQLNGRTIWELNVGYLADETSDPLRYNPVRTSKWTVGYGLITTRDRELCPQFVAFDK